jgi:subtilisin family serine protease/subtilisin-like proprotein convertase family protein
MNLKMMLLRLSRGTMLVVIITTTFFVGPIDTEAITGKQVTVRVPKEATKVIKSFGIQPILDLDYGSFHWLELTSEAYIRLQSSDIPYQLIRDAGQVQVSSYQFDPILDREPNLPDAIKSIDAGAGFRLIQFVGPIRGEWLEQLTGNGLIPLQYYPHNTYLVWGSVEQSSVMETYDFVRWQGAFHPAYKINNDLSGRTGIISNVDIMFYNDGDIKKTINSFQALGADIIQTFPSQPDRAFFNAIVELDARTFEDIARINTVLWIGYSHPEPVLDDEMSSQIVAGNHSGGVPAIGYNAHLSSLGVDGSGVIWSVIDTGVDYAHPDLNTHIVGGYSYPGAPSSPPGDDCSGGGHGTHVAGIVGGDAAAGYSDADGFLYGLGVAPAYSIFAQNSLCAPSWPPAGGWQEHSKQAVLGNAIGGNNSWTTGEGTQHGYQASERTHDIIVRDGNFDTLNIAEPFIEVFSAGNSGTSGLTAPKEAKNLIVVASSRNYRAGNIDDISSFSSRGPAVDGRWVPTIAAPGESIASAHRLAGTSQCTSVIAGTNNHYSWCSGTSMAAPQVSGVVVLATEWWRTFNSNADPSPAMAKALVVNTAVDMGTPDIPNINEGWGRVNVTDIISPSVPVLYYDQTSAFDNTGEQWELSLTVADPSKPLKITVAWSDAPGAVGANPALVNNLDLTVLNGGNTYYGNVFNSGWSNTGGSADSINNLENVYIQNPFSDVHITIDATNIAGDGIPYSGDTTDQDFALICQNCNLGSDFVLNVLPESLSICTPDDAIYDIEVSSILNYSDTVTLSVNGNPVGTNVNFSSNPITPEDPPATSTLTISNTGAAAFGGYSLDVIGVAPTSTHTVTVDLDIYTSIPGAPILLSPQNNAANVTLAPTFEWSAIPQADSYSLEVASDVDFSSIVYTATVQGTSHTPENELDSGAIYFWRVRANNICGVGDYASIFTFQTVLIQCRVHDSTDVPKVIPEGGGSSGTTISVLNVGDGGEIYDLNVHNLVGLHTYMGDLDFFLDSPASTQVQLMEQACGTAENFDLNLDDEAPAGPWPCPPIDGGTYQPTGLLADFDGEDSTGTWTLSIVDNFSGDTGSLQSWSLEICKVIDACIVPEVILNSNSPVELNQPMFFSADVISGTIPFTFTWDFGGPGYGTGLNTATPVFTYTQTGQYTVTVTVENECGIDSALTGVDVLDIAITGLTAVNDSPTELGYTTTMTAEIAMGTNVTYTWDFGDGIGDIGMVVTHVYSNTGVYTATVTAANGVGIQVASTPVTIFVIPPVERYIFLPLITR